MRNSLIKLNIKKKEQALLPRAAMLDRINHYRKKAKQRKLTWRLSTEECQKLFEQDCFYCGSPPSQVNKTKHGSSYTYNGIDRVDNAIGYEIDNVVSCCKYCNFAKHDQTMEEFQSWLADISAHYPTLLKKEAAIAI